MKLSLRMRAVADLVKPCAVLADVGCDHGYLSIDLVKSGTCSRAIAMDLREGPLSQAKENIKKEELSDCIECRLSDGLTKLKPDEADTILIAGMGGALMCDILTKHPECLDRHPILVLQPQSEIHLVRQLLHKLSYRIEEERFLLDDGKYYSAMRAVRTVQTETILSDFDQSLGVFPEADIRFSREERKEAEELLQMTVEDRYGLYNLLHPSKDFRDYLLWEKKQLSEALEKMKNASDSERIRLRGKELTSALRMNAYAESVCASR